MSNRRRRRKTIANDSLTELLQLRKNANLTTTRGRLKFLKRVYPIIENWHGRRPDLGKLFEAEAIDELLVLDQEVNEEFRRIVPFINFVAGLDYKDKSRVDASGRPIVQSTTPIHRVARRASFCYSSDLYKIYQPSYEANYRDESGFTHFHAACKFGFQPVVGKFLEAGRVDPDEPVPETGDTPLHLAIKHEHKAVFRQLLRAGADPNPANEAGETPLYLACRKDDDGAWAKMLLLESKQNRDPKLRIEARAVRLAVTSLQPLVLIGLLGRGFPDWNDFVFPEAQEFADVLAESRGGDRFAARLASAALSIVKTCANYGYDKRAAALAIMKAFDDHGLLERSARAVTIWRRELQEATSRLERDGNLELHDLIRLRPSDASRELIAAKRYDRLAQSSKLWMLPERLWEPCSLYLCEIIMRRFCWRWAVDSFVRMTQHELPHVCCYAILDNLTARDLCHICLAGDL